MVNVIKSDIYKTIKSTYFWVLSIIMLILYILSSCINLHFVNKAFIQAGICTNSFFLYLSSIPNSTYLFVCLFIMISTGLEFSSGSIKNIASKGYPREFLYFSKLICALLALVFYMLICAVGFLVCTQIMIGNKIPDFYLMLPDFASLSFLYTLQAIAYISIALMLAFLLRSSGISISIFCIFISMASILGSVIEFIIRRIQGIEFSIEPYLLSSCTLSSSEHLVRTIIVLLVYTLIPLIIGIYTFKKRDIK